jgi:hypothetical protein
MGGCAMAQPGHSHSFCGTEQGGNLVGSFWVGLNEKWVLEGVEDTPNF